jgi:hypothetical protein
MLSARKILWPPHPSRSAFLLIAVSGVPFVAGHPSYVDGDLWSVVKNSWMELTAFQFYMKFALWNPCL